MILRYLEETFMDETINRYELFELASNIMIENNFNFTIPRSNKLQKIYELSKTLLFKIEDYLSDEAKSLWESFYYQIDQNIQDAYNYQLFGDKLEGLKLEIRKLKNKKKPIKQIVYEIITLLQNIQNDCIKEMIHNNDFKIVRFGNNSIPQTFLSYAFEDMGLSYALFLYFAKNGGFLFVDWMWNDKGVTGTEIKENLNKELEKSKQLLFTLTPATELSVPGGNRTIRQWCAWEIGNYYNKNQMSKYMIDFYSNRPKSNLFIDSLKTFHYVKNGYIM